MIISVLYHNIFIASITHRTHRLFYASSEQGCVFCWCVAAPSGSRVACSVGALQQGCRGPTTSSTPGAPVTVRSIVSHCAPLVPLVLYGRMHIPVFGPTKRKVASLILIPRCGTRLSVADTTVLIRLCSFVCMQSIKGIYHVFFLKFPQNLYMKWFHTCTDLYLIG